MFLFTLSGDVAALHGLHFPQELASILRTIADAAEAGTTAGYVHDRNGTKIGVYMTTADLGESEDELFGPEETL